MTGCLLLITTDNVYAVARVCRTLQRSICQHSRNRRHQSRHDRKYAINTLQTAAFLYSLVLAVTLRSVTTTFTPCLLQISGTILSKRCDVYIPAGIQTALKFSNFYCPPTVTAHICIVRLKRGGTSLCEKAGFKGKQANRVGNQLMKRERQVTACTELLPCYYYDVYTSPASARLS
jgi:hypothetical protein